MVSEKALNGLAAVISAVVAVTWVIVHRIVDLGPWVDWPVLAFLTGILIWRLRHRSPYRRDKKVFRDGE